jgi:hypothetical protein
VTGIESAPTRLKDMAERFRVCWEVWPEEIFTVSKRQIGYALELIGTHEAGVEHPQPGCEHCRHVFEALREIAEWVLPRETRPSIYEIGPFDQSLRYSPARRNRPDVILTVKILHREGFDRPVDECEDRCLKEMEQRLRELGASRKQWAPRNI